jgi:transcriptional regulator with XRE-family HTH domain
MDFIGSLPNQKRLIGMLRGERQAQTMAENPFAEWLKGELAARNWSQTDLGRDGGVTSAAISRILSGERKAGPDACNAIARALQLPAELVFRKAGLLPEGARWTDEQAELLHLFDQLSPYDQAEMVAIARLKLRLREAYDD